MDRNTIVKRFVEERFGISRLYVRSMESLGSIDCWRATLESMDETHDRIYELTYRGLEGGSLIVYQKLTSHEFVLVENP